MGSTTQSITGGISKNIYSYSVHECTKVYDVPGNGTTVLHTLIFIDVSQ